MVKGGLGEIQERLKSSWQLPVLLAGTFMLLGGFWLAFNKVTPRPPQVNDLLAVTGKQVDESKPEPDLALQNLEILENEAVMNDEQKSLFHLYYARALFLKQQAQNEEFDYADRGYGGWRQAVEDNPGFAKEASTRYQNVIGQYDAVQRMQPSLLKDRDLKYQIESELYLGKSKEALERLRDLDQESALKHDLMRAMIEDALITNTTDYSDLRELLSRYYDEPGLSVERRIWATNRMAEVMLRNGNYREAEKFLLWRQPILAKASEISQLELKTLLGEAQRRSGTANAPEKARKTLEEVELAMQDPRIRGQLPRETKARLFLNMGALAMGFQNTSQAKDAYEQVLNHFDVPPMSIEARIGLASANLRFGSDLSPQSWELFERAIREVKNDYPSDQLRSHLKKVLIDDRNWQRTDNQSSHNLSNALRLLELEEELDGQLSADSLKARAEIYEQDARRRFELHMDDKIRAGRPPREATLDNIQAWSSLDPEIRRQLRKGFEAAADTWKDYSLLVQDNNDLYGDAILKAAENYGLANDHREEADMLDRFLRTNENVKNRPQILYRLGMAYLGVGDLPGISETSRVQAWEKATNTLEELVRSSDESASKIEAYLPLARAYEYLDRLEASKNTLELMIEGGLISPENYRYQEAQAMLGLLMYKRGNDRDFMESAKNLRLALSRHELSVKREMIQEQEIALEEDPGAPDIIQKMDQLKATSPTDLAIQRYAREASFKLPDLAEHLGMALQKLNEGERSKIRDEGLTPEELRTKESQIKANLQEAAGAFRVATRSLKERISYLDRNEGNRSLSEPLTERLMNAYFLEADAYYELEEWDKAIRIYEEITRGWKDEPRSLMAYVRLINAHIENNQQERADQENLNLRDQIKRFSTNELLNNSALPDSFWDDWYQLMNRIDTGG